MDDGSSIFMITALIVLIMLSAFFSASETAYSSLNMIRLKSRAEDGDKQAAKVLALAERYDSLLSTILIGNNIVNIGASSLATVLFSRLLGNAYGPTASTIVMTLLVLTFGEITPKSMAKEMPESIAMAFAPALGALVAVFGPLNFIFGKWKSFLASRFYTDEKDTITEGELVTMVSEAEKDGELTNRESELIRSAIEFDDVVKMGRTQLQDAVPIRLGQSFEAYAAVIERDIRRIRSLDSEIKVLNIGATAVGTAINVNPVYLFHIIRNVNLVCGTDCSQAEDLFDATQNLDGFVHTSAALRVCAVNLSKICNDLRLLSSGPKAGLGEINLPPKQNGSSIMPGKINPVIPEVVSQVAYNVIGNDVTVTMAAEAGQLELNAFEPVIFYKIFESIDTLRGAVETLIDNCILGITANRERCRALVESSAALATALCPALGYKKSAEIAKKCNRTGIPVRQIVLEEGLLPEEELDRYLSLVDMTQAGHPVDYKL